MRHKIKELQSVVAFFMQYSLAPNYFYAQFNCFA